MEVVARQIPGRSRPATGKSRGYVGIEKPPILCSRQELAERLRQAWKHREENKTNINIFLAHGTVEKRCDSAMSSHASAATPSPPLLKNNGDKAQTPGDCATMRRPETRESETRANFDGDHVEREDDNVKTNVALTDDDSSARKFGNELPDFADSGDETRKITALTENEDCEAATTEGPRESDLREIEEDVSKLVYNVNMENIQRTYRMK